jgi:hypothetical protein
MVGRRRFNDVAIAHEQRTRCQKLSNSGRTFEGSSLAADS